jgi:magnesium transporter
MFEIGEQMELTRCDPASAAEAARSPDSRIWIDLEGADGTETAAWLERLDVKGLARRLCLESRDRPGFYPLNKEIVLVAPVLCEATIAGNTDYLALLCRENMLLTLHRTPVVDTEELVSLHESETWLPDRSIAGLVSALIMGLSLDGLGHVNALRGRVIAMEDRMDREPEAVQAEEILELRSNLMTLASAVSDQLPSLQALSTTDRPHFRLQDARDYLNCALANARAADGSLTWLDQRVGALRSGFEMHAQDRTNRRLGMLTILSAIFLPITLLASIWGMNFEIMPELRLPFGYPAALGLMCLVGAGMYFFFRRTGWFG